MKRFWPPRELIADYMSGTCLKSERSNLQKMLKMGLLNFCLFMVDIQLKYQISHGIQTIHGLSVLYQRTILCRLVLHYSTRLTYRDNPTNGIRLLRRFPKINTNLLLDVYYRSGKWQKIFTMMRKSTHQLQKLRINNSLQVLHM